MQSSVQLPTMSTPPGLSNSKLTALGGGSTAGSLKYNISVVTWLNSVIVIFLFVSPISVAWVLFLCRHL